MTRENPLIIILTIIAVAAALMFQAAKDDSAIMDELAHIPAGYGYVRYFDFRLNPEHPPLLKALSALPLLPLNLEFPTEQKSWREDINGQWETGYEFLYALGNDANQIIARARIFPILLTLLLVFLIYLWSKELLGKWFAIAPAAFFGLSPTILAHGHYVTTDIAAAFGVFLAIYSFVKFLLEPSRKRLFLAGLALGMAQLLKFSLALLIPYFIVLTAIFVFVKIKTRSRLYYFRSLLFIFLITLAVIYAVYFIFTLNYPQEKQTADTAAILNSFNPRFLADFTVTLAKNPVTKPLAEYFLGLLMVMQRAVGGNTVYFLGEVSAAGSKLYFPLVFLMKETLPALILIFSGLVFSVGIVLKKNLRKPFSSFKNYLETNFAEFAMLLFTIVYWTYSIKSNLNIGVRHLMPTLPFIYILAAQCLKNIRLPAKKIMITLLILWQIAETLIAYPYFLSYFNEFFGGTKSGYRYVTDSNYDWGQDLKRLALWVKEKNINKIAVDYFGGGNPKYYLGDTGENWRSSRGNPKNENIEWLAVSINTLEGAFGKLPPGQQRNSVDEYSWLKETKPALNGMGEVSKPDAVIGTSIFVYHLQ